MTLATKLCLRLSVRHLSPFLMCRLRRNQNAAEPLRVRGRQPLMSCMLVPCFASVPSASPAPCKRAEVRSESPLGQPLETVPCPVGGVGSCDADASRSKISWNMYQGVGVGGGTAWREQQSHVSSAQPQRSSQRKTKPASWCATLVLVVWQSRRPPSSAKWIAASPAGSQSTTRTESWAAQGRLSAARPVMVGGSEQCLASFLSVELLRQCC